MVWDNPLLFYPEDLICTKAEKILRRAVDIKANCGVLEVKWEGSARTPLHFLLSVKAILEMSSFTLPHIIPNLCEFLYSVESKRRKSEDCAGCWFTPNYNEWALRLSSVKNYTKGYKIIIKVVWATLCYITSNTIALGVEQLENNFIYWKSAHSPIFWSVHESKVTMSNLCRNCSFESDLVK